MKRTLCILLSLLLCAGALLLPAAAEEPPVDPTAVTQSEPAATDTTAATEPAATDTTAATEPATEDTTAATEPAVTDTTAATEPAAEDTTAATEPSAEDTTAATEPSAEDTTAATEPEKETEPQQETTAADTDGATRTPPLSPYHPPKWEDYNGDRDAFDRDEYAWFNSIYCRYYRWRANDPDDTAKFDPAFRAFYADDPELKISGHFVYKPVEVTRYDNKTRVKVTVALLFDYFDTDEAEKQTTALRIPATLDGYELTPYMYRNDPWDGDLLDSGYTNNTVKKLVIEEGVTGISMSAFSSFTALKYVVLPRSLTTIGIMAFKDCTNLRKVLGGENLASLGSAAFGGCEKLYAVEAMEHIRAMDGAAFRGCAFKTLTLPGDVRLGGGDEDHYDTDNVFADCKKLKKVTFLDAGKKTQLLIGNGAFCDCPKLKTVVFPLVSKTIAIGDRVFRNDTSLTTIKNPEKLRYIGRMAFQNCESLTAFTLPEKFVSADFDSFLGCKKLKTVTILSKDTALFDKSYDPYILYWQDVSDMKVPSNFLLALPKSCTVLVVSKEMKDAVKAHRFKGTVKISVAVKAPAQVKLAKQNGKTTVKWSKVKAADGYRVWSYNAKTGKYTKLATVKAGVTSVTLKTAATRFAVRAYRVIDKDVSWSPIVRTK